MTSFADLTPATVARPVVSRSAEPNPFLDAVASLAADREKALTYTLPTEKDATEDDKRKVVNRFLNLVSEASKVHNVTVRKLVAEDGVTVTIWAIDRITRPGGSEDAGAPVASA